MNIRNIPFKPLCPPEVVDRARQWLRDNRDDFCETANYCVFTKDNEYAYLDKGCHAGIGFPVHTDVECVATEICFRDNDWSEPSSDVVIRFLTWLVQKSFFSPFILNGDDLTFCREYGIIISSDIPSALLQNICIISRHFYECPHRVFEHFNELSSLYGPEVAYSVAFNTPFSQYEDLINQNRSVRLVPNQAVHRASPTWKSVKEMNNFQKGEFNLDPNPAHFYRKFQTIMGGALYCVEGEWDHNRTFATEVTQTKDFLEFAKKFPNGMQEKPIPNPFNIRKPEDQLYRGYPDYDQLNNIVLPFMQEKGYFNVH